jgi:hypothetical protein
MNELNQLQQLGTMLGSAIGGWLVAVMLWQRLTRISSDYNAYLKEQAKEASERARAAESRLDELRSATRPTLSADDRSLLTRRARQTGD